MTLRDDLSDNEITSYIDKESPLDCAGSYKIEGLGISLFDKVSTSDFTAIIGLPLIDLSKILRQYQLEIP